MERRPVFLAHGSERLREKAGVPAFVGRAVESAGNLTFGIAQAWIEFDQTFGVKCFYLETKVFKEF